MSPSGEVATDLQLLHLRNLRTPYLSFAYFLVLWRIARSRKIPLCVLIELLYSIVSLEDRRDRCDRSK
jgi:hypothetical protein